MSRVNVCSLRLIDETARQTGARSLVTLINVGTPVGRPTVIEADRHLFIGVSDIVEPMDGHIHPAEEHVEKLLDFARSLGPSGADDRALLCRRVSRSTAAAFIIACAVAPERAERRDRANDPRGFADRDAQPPARRRRGRDARA